MAKYQYAPIPKPDTSRLPFFNNQGGWHEYLPVVAAERRYWRQILRDAEAAGDIGRFAAAEQVHDPLQGVTRSIITPELIESEPIRRVGLGALALGRLMRDILGEGGARFADPVAHQVRANIFISLSSDAAGLPDGVAVFAQPGVLPANMFPPDPPPDGWYEREGLLVRRTLPHVPSPALEQYARLEGLGDAFDGAVGLQPFVPLPDNS